MSESETNWSGNRKTEKLSEIGNDNWNGKSFVLNIRVATHHNTRYKQFGH
ncbi:MAG: hypothetical protein ABI576_07150 [Flavobacterium sp.]